MAIAAVPWFVGGGAEHSPEVARNMLHIATMRTQGIVGTSDFRVSPLNVPGAGVKVGYGSALIQLYGTPEEQQTYSAFAATNTNVSVTPTGSASGRSDMVILRVEDPAIPGQAWATPANVKAGPYVFLRVLPNVPAGATTLAQAGYAGNTAIPLARIDFPPSTGTVTAGMITDLRQMAQPRQLTLKNIAIAPLPSTMLSSSDWTNWISSYNPGVIVPEWATHAQTAYWLGGIYTAGPCDGSIRHELWGPNYVNAFVGPEQAFDQDVPVAAFGGTAQTSTGGGATRFSLSGGAYGEVFQFRGQYVYHRVGAKVLVRSDRSNVAVDAKSSLMFEINFVERPI